MLEYPVKTLEEAAYLLRHGKAVAINSVTLFPVDKDKIQIEDGDLFNPEYVGVGTVVLCRCKGEVIFDRIQEFQQSNYLPRFKVNDKWIGKTKILGKADNIDDTLSKITLDGKIHLMLLDETVEALHSLEGHNFLLMSDPETPDFTADSPKGKLYACTKGGAYKSEIPLDDTKHNLIRIFSALQNVDPSQKDRVIIGWNLKGLYSFVLGKTKRPLLLNGRIIDLQVMERFFAINKPRPKTYHEAERRLSEVMVMPSFNRFKEIYKSIHKPLMTEILPQMETLGMADSSDVWHSCYDIEGQINGRLRASQAFKRSFNPHGLTDERKSQLKSTNPNEAFWMYFDFKSMEVFVLYWLSNDPNLGKILKTSNDLYSAIWTELTGQDCNDHYRKICKQIFLPVVFGATAKSLCKRIPKMLESTAQQIIKRIYIRFPVAMNWVQEQQDSVSENGIATDYFDRRRHFEGEFYKVRNFVIQSPAALVCLHKLVKLHQALEDFELGRMAYHVHDGYMVRTTESHRNEVYSVAQETLESPEPLYPGLTLKVGCEAGTNLGSLSPFSN